MKNRLFILYLIVCPLSTWGQTFIYPMPPDSICERQSRINYMAEHFWTEKAIADTANFQNPKLLLDYLYLLKQADEQQKYAQSFVASASKQENTFGLILYWLDNILYDSSSPYYDEPLYLMLMKSVINTDVDSVMKLIPRQRIEILEKNQVGKATNDFSVMDMKGNYLHLYSINSPFLLLIFNHPECSLCHKTEENIESNSFIQRLLIESKLKVLAITIDAERGEWERHAYPKNWIVGLDVSKEIYSKRLYDIQRLPSLYLLDKEKRVLLKEADYSRLHKYLLDNSILFEY